MSDLNKWAEKLTEEVYEECKGRKWVHGVKIFFSPVRTRPNLMIISYQPGGDYEDFEKKDKDFFVKRDFRVPHENEYFTEKYRFAREMQKYFESNLVVLEKSVAVPLIFFRASSDKIWKKESKESKKEMVSFCLDRVKEIIEKLKPRKILVVGFETLDLLQKKIFVTSSNQEVLATREKNNQHKLFTKALCDKYEVFTMIHPTGAHLSNKEKDKIKKQLKKNFL